MADATISALSAAVNVVGTDLLPIVNSNETKKATVAQVTSAVAQAISIVSVAQAATSANLTSARDALSNAVSALSDAHTSLVNRVSANSGVGGGGSVTSNELSIAVAAESAGRVSADNALSNAISVISVNYASLVNRVSANSAQMVSADNAISNAVSIVSAAVLVISNKLSGASIHSWSSPASAVTSVRGLQSALNMISNTFSAAFQNGSAVSADLTSVKAIVSNLTSAHNALSNTVSSNSADVTSVKAVLSNLTSAHNALSNTVSGLGGGGASVTSAEYLSLVNRVSANSGTGGTGSVTSNELSAAVAAESAGRVSADNALSNLISGLSVNLASVDARASIISAAHTSLVDRVSANSTQMTSADNAISNAVSIVSVAAANAISGVNAVSQRLSALVLDSILNVSAPSPTSTQVLKYNSAAAQWVASADATGGAGGSVTSQELSVLVAAESAGRVSADNALSNLISALSAIVSSNSAQMTSANNAISNAVSIVSQAVSALSNQNSVDHASIRNLISVVSNAVSIVSAQVVTNSAQMTSANNAISNAVSIVSVAAANAISGVNAVSQRLSALVLDSIANVSTGTPGDAQVLTWNSAAAQWVASTITAGVVSVTSTEVSAVSAAAASAAATLSSRVDSVWSVISNALSAGDVKSNKISVLSNKVSLRAPWLDAEIRILSNLKSNNTSTLSDISGLVLTVAAGETWEVEGMIFTSTSAIGAGLKLGTSVAPLSTPRFIWMNAGIGTQSALARPGGGLLQVSGNSANFSIASTAANTPFVNEFRAIFNVASAGTFRMMYSPIASATASPMHVLPGSYFKAFRLK